MLAIVEAFAKGPKGIDSTFDKVGRIVDHCTLVHNARDCNLVLVASSRVFETLSCCIDDRNVRIDRRRSRSTRKSCCRTRVVDTCHGVDCGCDVDVYVVVRFLVVVVVVLDVVLVICIESRLDVLVVAFVVVDVRRC